MIQDYRPGRGWSRLVAVCLLAAAPLATIVATPTAGQDAAFGRDVWLSGANCADCHGWLADGIPEDPRSPKGANIRETILNQEQLIEIILCGRPGTAMPHFDPRAYTDQRCYGSTRAEMGDATPPQGDAALTRRHAVGLSLFLLQEFVGKGPPTFEDCTGLLGEANPRCALLPHRAN